MTYYGALDSSLETTAICLLDERGRIVKEAVCASSPAAIFEALEGFLPELARVGLETGPQSAWLYEGLRVEGLPVVVIDAVHASAMLKGGFRNKTDRNDARGLADMMRVNKYRPVWVKSQAGRQGRALLAAREQLVKTRTALTNCLRGLLRGAGLEAEAASGGDFAARVRAAAGAERALRVIVEPLLATLATVERQVARYDLWIKQLAGRDEVCRLLMTCPGVGPQTAFGFRVTIDDPQRFRRARDVGAYFGLTPRRHQSGALDYSGRISRMGDAAMRRLLYMAALNCQGDGPRDSLRAWALNLTKRRGGMRARVALARKLAVILHRMWLDRTPYRATVRGAAKAA